MSVVYRRLLVCLALLSGSVQGLQFPVAPDSPGEMQLKNIVMDQQGWLSNVGGDGYLVISGMDLSRSESCLLSLEIEFQEPLQRPGLFELFWRQAGQEFSEGRKAFVIINQAWTQARQLYQIPLCKLYQFSGNLQNPKEQLNIEGLRIDLPSNKDVTFKIHQLRLQDGMAMLRVIQGARADEIILEPYERVDARAFTSLDVALPKLSFAWREGMHRLTIDKPFLVFWFLMLLGLIGLLLRSFFTSTRL